MCEDDGPAPQRSEVADSNSTLRPHQLESDFHVSLADPRQKFSRKMAGLFRKMPAAEELPPTSKTRPIRRRLLFVIHILCRERERDQRGLVSTSATTSSQKSRRFYSGVSCMYLTVSSKRYWERYCHICGIWSATRAKAMRCVLFPLVLFFALTVVQARTQQLAFLN